MIKRLNNLSNTKDRNKRITFLLEDHTYVPRKKKKKGKIRPQAREVL